MLKIIVLQNFATVAGTPTSEEKIDKDKHWSVVALSERLLNENRLNGLQLLNTRRLDLIIRSGTRLALFNLQAFKIFECPLATDTIRQCVSHYITPNGNLLFGVQPSGEVIVLTEGLQKTKTVRKPAFIKIQQKTNSRWYNSLPLIPSLLEVLTGGSKTKINRVAPDRDAESPSWWPSTTNFSEPLRSKFPYLTALQDGLAVLCAFSPINCYIFLSSYQTALRDKSIANYKGSLVPGRWYRIIMHKSFIQKWLEDKRIVPWFEAKLCYTQDDNGNPLVSGAMVYALMEGVRLELVYGVITSREGKFTLSWEIVQYDVDWALKEPSMPYNLGSKFVARFSSDCKKLAIVIGTHLGVYVHIQQVPFYPSTPIKLERKGCAICNHSDFDEAHFYKSDCWVADIQWLVEDAYLAVMTLCGSLAIFYASGEPMVLKVRKPGVEPDEDKSNRFFFPVFHPQQVESSSKGTSTSSTQKKSRTVYPTLNWIDSEKVLACSSGTKVELFAIQRVLNVPTEDVPRSGSALQKVSSSSSAEEEEEEDSITLLMEACKKDDTDNGDLNNNNSSATDEDAKSVSVKESEVIDVDGVYHRHHHEQET